MAEVRENKEFPARVVEVFSADDLILMVDLGIAELHLRQRVRLHGVDAPSAINAGADTEAGRLRNQVRALSRERPATLRLLSKVGASWVGVVTLHTREGEVNLNELLIAQGYRYQRAEAVPVVPVVPADSATPKDPP
jgi:hypothetical protein